jgi:hypothetical protein
MLTIPDHKGNSNQNYTSPLLEWLSSRISPSKNVAEDEGKKNPHTLLMGMSPTLIFLKRVSQILAGSGYLMTVFLHGYSLCVSYFNFPDLFTWLFSPAG